jgi:hypothetical protein
MATAGDLITAAVQKIGIDNPSPAQTASALISRNNLISLEGADFMPPYLVSETLTLTVGDAEYTIGPSGDLDTVRPIKIESCYLRNSANQDFPVRCMSGKDYSEIYTKNTEGIPNKIYFISEYPLAKIKFNYEPNEAYTAYFEFWKNFTEFATTATSVTLPNEYKEYLVYNLAVSVAEDWDRKVSQTLYARAKETKFVIECLNASNKPVPMSKFDIVTGVRRNIITDTEIY